MKRTACLILAAICIICLFGCTEKSADKCTEVWDWARRIKEEDIIEVAAGAGWEYSREQIRGLVRLLNRLGKWNFYEYSPELFGDTTPEFFITIKTEGGAYHITQEIAPVNIIPYGKALRVEFRGKLWMIDDAVLYEFVRDSPRQRKPASAAQCPAKYRYSDLI